MICTDVLSIIPTYAQDWKTLAIMSTVCKSWKAAVEAHAGPNYKMDRGQYKGESIYKLIVSYPSYLEYMLRDCKQYHLGPILKTIQPRSDIRFTRMPFGKHKGRLVVRVPHSYSRWLRTRCDDKYVKKTLSLRYGGIYVAPTPSTRCDMLTFFSTPRF
jgi:uncharacterized protein (DUF3820 family)